ncbi:MAG: RdgB/HAM1 family non-canonical purine NTP pyrophosphatase [Alphaproteobacteria bacterium]
MKKFKDNKLVLASHNKGKLVEIKEMLAPFNIEVLSAGDFNLDEPEETGTTFAENALLKANYVASKTGYTALADDSGLCVNALDGQPGIYSARWAGENKDFIYAMNKVNNKLEELKTNDRSAYFACVLALVCPENKEEYTFEGRVEGDLIWPISGNNGFGFDPMFMPKGYDKTFGELDHSIKQTISHRSNAFKKFKAFLEK